jgi:predicted metal-dependent hydrolase
VNTPQYSVRVSPRARHVRLKVTPTDGLCVVIPRGFDPAEIPALVQKRQSWIEKALKDVAAKVRPIAADYMPDKLVLPAVGETWQINYQQGSKRASLNPDPDSLQLAFFAAEHDQAKVFSMLRRWLKTRANEALQPWVYSLAQELNFEISRVTIRNQRSRWGSCSSKKSLSLNLKLLFLQPDEVQHVLVHELCHTVQPNHSPRFWQLVEQHEPGYRQMTKTLKNAWRQVPRWV